MDDDLETCVELVVFSTLFLANLLGSGGLQVTVSSSIDPSPMGLEPATYTSEALVAQYLHGS